MARLPFDNEPRRTDARACAIVHYGFDANHWQYRELTGADVGCDCELELSEDNKWLGNKIECQIKGTRNLGNYVLADGSVISFPLEIKTINYGLRKANSFVLLLVDVETESIYYRCLQEHFIDDPSLGKKLEKEDASTINIRIPIADCLGVDDSPLQEIARARYAMNGSGELSRVNVALNGDAASEVGHE